VAGNMENKTFDEISIIYKSFQNYHRATREGFPPKEQTEKTSKSFQVVELDGIRFFKLNENPDNYTCFICQQITHFRTYDISTLKLFAQIGRLEPSTNWEIIDHSSFKFIGKPEIFNYYLSICCTDCWEKFKEQYQSALVYILAKGETCS
jgi:hypothetical protein